MKKNIVKINEAQLKKIVAESVKRVVNEAYGTTDTHTQDIVNNLRDPYDEGGDRSKLRSFPANPTDNIRDRINKFKSDLNLALTGLLVGSDFWHDTLHKSWQTNLIPGGEREDIEQNIPSGVNTQIYLDAIEKQVKRAMAMADKLKKALVMDMGVQPDEKYFDRH